MIGAEMGSLAYLSPKNRRTFNLFLAGREFENGRLVIILPRPKHSRGKIWLIGRVRKMLRFQAETGALEIRLASFAGEAAIQEIAGVKLDARLGGVNL